MVVTTTLLGWMPMGTDAPFDLSRWTRSTWITHFLRYTWVTLPSRPLYLPRTIRTSSSLRMGIDRVCSLCYWTSRRNLPAEVGRTLYLVRSSLESEEDMILRLTEEGAAKCALRDLRREEETSAHRGDRMLVHRTDRTHHIRNASAQSIPFHLSGRPETSRQHQDSVSACNGKVLTGVELHLDGLEDVGGDDGRFSSLNRPGAGVQRSRVTAACHAVPP